MNKNGRIVRSLSGFYEVETKEGVRYQTRARGNFRKTGQKPLVGDWVSFITPEKSEGYVLSIETRHNQLVRPPIANIDQAVVVMSMVEPAFSSNLLDRFLVLLTHKRIKPIIYLTKLDLLADLKGVKAIEQAYQSIGYTVYYDVEQLSHALKDQVTVFMGQTGVGKSTLLNRLAPEMTLATAEISEKLGRGKHTTRHVELFHVKAGLIADTPGFSSIDYEVTEPQVLNHAFPELARLSEDCKFRACTHTHEPDCAVKRAYDAGQLLASRYQHYLQFLSEITQTRQVYKKAGKKK